MKWTSILAIYLLFWVMAAFLVMPFGLRTHEDDHLPKVLGQADSAPLNFNPRRIALRATVLSLVLFGLFYLNLAKGWIKSGDLDFFTPPASLATASD